jgi:hypothetical protein
MGRNVRACGKNSGGLGNRAKFWKVLAHSYEVGSGPFLSLDVLQNGSLISSSCFSVSFEGSRYFCVVARDSWPSLFVPQATPRRILYGPVGTSLMFAG